MGKPRLIILIRHAQSEGNKNREIHQTTPDHRVKLTAEGKKQAFEAGRKLRGLLRPDDTLHFYTSPYRRTRETTEGILSSLTSDDPTPSPFPRHTIKVYEEPRLREQDFGNFQPDSAEMSRMWHDRANYGHFFYRIPNGESAADAYDRVSGFNESLWRSFGEDDFASVCVLVTHGLMTRVFLMKWYHWSVEYFEDLRNINHCEFIVMQKNRENGKYILKNQLRTWTQYKAEKRAEEERDAAAAAAAASSSAYGSPVPPRKRYGDAPHDKRHDGSPNAVRPHRQNTADLFREDGTSVLHLADVGISRKQSQRSAQHSPREPIIPESPAGPSRSSAGEAQSRPQPATAVSIVSGSSSFKYPKPANNTDPFPAAITDAVTETNGPIFAQGGQLEASGGASGGGIRGDDERLDSPEVQSSLMPTTAPLLKQHHYNPADPKAQPAAAIQRNMHLRIATAYAGRDGGGSNSGTGSRSDSSDEGEVDERRARDDDENLTPLATKPGEIGIGSLDAALGGLRTALPPVEPGQKSGLGLGLLAAEERRRQFRPPRSMQLALQGQLSSSTGEDDGDAMAEPLGDQSDMDDEEDRRDGDLQGHMATEGGFAGSVR